MGKMGGILRQKAKGERNRVGDHWGDHICSEAADLLDEAERALMGAMEFIADEYRDPAAEEYGEWLAAEARPIFAALSSTLARIRGGQ